MANKAGHHEACPDPPVGGDGVPCLPAGWRIMVFTSPPKQFYRDVTIANFKRQYSYYLIQDEN
jgi:hypothetical protein